MLSRLQHVLIRTCGMSAREAASARATARDAAPKAGTAVSHAALVDASGSRLTGAVVAAGARGAAAAAATAEQPTAAAQASAPAAAVQAPATALRAPTTPAATQTAAVPPPAAPAPAKPRPGAESLAVLVCLANPDNLAGAPALQCAMADLLAEEAMERCCVEFVCAKRNAPADIGGMVTSLSDVLLRRLPLPGFGILPAEWVPEAARQRALADALLLAAPNPQAVLRTLRRRADPPGARAAFQALTRLHQLLDFGWTPDACAAALTVSRIALCAYATTHVEVVVAAVQLLLHWEAIVAAPCLDLQIVAHELTLVAAASLGRVAAPARYREGALRIVSEMAPADAAIQALLRTALVSGAAAAVVLKLLEEAPQAGVRGDAAKTFWTRVSVCLHIVHLSQRRVPAPLLPQVEAACIAALHAPGATHAVVALAAGVLVLQFWEPDSGLTLLRQPLRGGALARPVLGWQTAALAVIQKTRIIALTARAARDCAAEARDMDVVAVRCLFLVWLWLPQAMHNAGWPGGHAAFVARVEACGVREALIALKGAVVRHADPSFDVKCIAVVLAALQRACNASSAGAAAALAPAMAEAAADAAAAALLAEEDAVAQRATKKSAVKARKAAAAEALRAAVAQLAVAEAAQAQAAVAAEARAARAVAAAVQSDDDGDEGSCVICMDRARTTALVPCGHALLCAPCGDKVLRTAAPACPVCRAPATGCRNAPP